MVALLLVARGLQAHDLERTQVSLTFARDGSFVLDVANDPSWLKLRLEAFPGTFADRVVLWVDGREVRPTSVEYVAPRNTEDIEKPLGTHRLRGRLPADAHTLRWYYGLVIDPYPLTIRRADGRILASWGKVGRGPGEFDWVHGIVVDSKGAVYAADTYGQRLQKFVPASTSTSQR